MIMILKVIMMFTKVYETNYANVELSFTEGDDDIESHYDVYTKIGYKWLWNRNVKRLLYTSQSHALWFNVSVVFLEH